MAHLGVGLAGGGAEREEGAAMGRVQGQDPEEGGLVLCWGSAI